MHTLCVVQDSGGHISPWLFLPRTFISLRSSSMQDSGGSLTSMKLLSRTTSAPLFSTLRVSCRWPSLHSSVISHGLFPSFEHTAGPTNTREPNNYCHVEITAHHTQLETRSNTKDFPAECRVRQLTHQRGPTCTTRKHITLDRCWHVETMSLVEASVA